MTRRVTVGPATPVYITNPEDIVVNVGDITLGAVSISGVADGVDVTQGAIADAAVTGNDYTIDKLNRHSGFSSTISESISSPSTGPGGVGWQTSDANSLFLRMLMGVGV